MQCPACGNMMRLNGDRYQCFNCGYLGPAYFYEVRHHTEHGYYAVDPGGRLFHETLPDGGRRAGFFKTEAELQLALSR